MPSPTRQDPHDVVETGPSQTALRDRTLREDTEAIDQENTESIQKHLQPTLDKPIKLTKQARQLGSQAWPDSPSPVLRHPRGPDPASPRVQRSLRVRHIAWAGEGGSFWEVLELRVPHGPVGSFGWSFLVYGAL